MIITTQFDMFFSENEKSFAITKAKVASRYLTELYHPTTHIVPLDINLEILDNNLHKEAKDIFYRFCDIKNNKKNILLFYRNPFSRYISGTIEDLLVSIGVNNFNEKYFLRHYFNKFNIDVFEFYKKLEEHNENRDFLLEDSYLELLTNLLEDWFVWQNYTSPVTSHHASPYLSIYDSIMKSPNVDVSKVRLINIDSNNITEILQPYFDNKIEINHITQIQRNQSNKNFTNFIKNMIESNSYISTIVNNVCEIDNYFYQEFENSPYNIKNIK